MMMIFVLLFNWKLSFRPKLMQNSLGFWILRYGFWILDSLLVKLGFQIPIISGIPDSLSWISESRYLFPGDKMATVRWPTSALRTPNDTPYL